MTNSAHLQNSETEPWTIEYVAEVDTTQTILLERAANGTLADRTALRTDFQRVGRGRLDRRWGAPPGTALLVSLGFTDVPDDPGQLMRRVGVAAVDALGSFGVEQAGLKWPNDVMIGGRKTAGMLAQRSPLGPVVVGLGLNVGWAPEGATSLSEHCDPPTPRPSDVLERLLERYDALDDGAVVAQRYRSVLVTLGQTVRVELAAGAVIGLAVDIGECGELDVRLSDGEIRRLLAGDVYHLRPTDAGGG